MGQGCPQHSIHQTINILLSTYNLLENTEDVHPTNDVCLPKGIRNPLGDEQESDHDPQENHVPDIRLFKMNSNKKITFTKIVFIFIFLLQDFGEVKRRPFHPEFLPASKKT